MLCILINQSRLFTGMSIRDLPHEVLNLVFSQIHDKTSAPTGTHFPSVSFLSLHKLTIEYYSRIPSHLLVTLPHFQIPPPSRSRISLLSPSSLPNERPILGELPRSSPYPPTATLTSHASRSLVGGTAPRFRLIRFCRWTRSSLDSKIRGISQVLLPATRNL